MQYLVHTFVKKICCFFAMHISLGILYLIATSANHTMEEGVNLLRATAQQAIFKALNFCH